MDGRLALAFVGGVALGFLLSWAVEAVPVIFVHFMQERRDDESDDEIEHKQTNK